MVSARLAIAIPATTRQDDAQGPVVSIGAGFERNDSHKTSKVSSVRVCRTTLKTTLCLPYHQKFKLTAIGR